MFRLWGKLFKNNKLLKDFVYENDDPDASRTSKVLNGLETICCEMDLGVPIWLDSNIAEFRQISRTRFTPDSFIEGAPFDHLEIQVIEDD